MYYTLLQRMTQCTTCIDIIYNRTTDLFGSVKEMPELASQSLRVYVCVSGVCLRTGCYREAGSPMEGIVISQTHKT